MRMLLREIADWAFRAASLAASAAFLVLRSCQKVRPKPTAAMGSALTSATSPARSRKLTPVPSRLMLRSPMREWTTLIVGCAGRRSRPMPGESVGSQQKTWQRSTTDDIYPRWTSKGHLRTSSKVAHGLRCGRLPRRGSFPVQAPVAWLASPARSTAPTGSIRPKKSERPVTVSTRRNVALGLTTRKSTSCATAAR
jgi:hypothetical protein